MQSAVWTRFRCGLATYWQRKRKRREQSRRKSLNLLVEQRGIEPLTSALRTRRSAKLSYCPTREAMIAGGFTECQVCPPLQCNLPQAFSAVVRPAYSGLMPDGRK